LLILLLFYSKLWLKSYYKWSPFWIHQKVDPKDIGYDQDNLLDIDFWLGYQGGFKEKYEIIHKWS
jgi:hypothetical protein